MKIVSLIIFATLPFLMAAEKASPISTFSIVAHDPQTGELGVAVQSKLVAVGAIVPYAQASIGAIATQAWGNTRFGPIGLELLRNGANAEKTLSIMIKADPNRAHRQLAIIDINGNVSVHTGKDCMDWAGHKTGKGYSVQGNLLVGPEVINSMAHTFENSNGSLAQRMIDSLRSAQKQGGDRRGRQSAALLVVRKGWGYGGLNDRFRDIRVDDHVKPIEELQRIYHIHKKTFPRPDEK